MYISEIQDLIYSKLGDDDNILIVKERQVGATTFLLECCEEFEKLGKKCLFVCFNKDSARVTKHFLKEYVNFDVIIYRENIRGKRYDVVIFDEIGHMDYYDLKDILNCINWWKSKCLKIFTLTLDSMNSCKFLYTPKETPIMLTINKLIKFEPTIEKSITPVEYNCQLCENEKYILKLLQHRLSDNRGNAFPSSVYSIDSLYSFIDQSVSMFNSIPFFTDYSLDNSKFVRVFADIIVQGAVMLALGSQALKEIGREWVQESNGIKDIPPSVSEILQQQYHKEMDSYLIKIQLIKQNPLGLSFITTEKECDEQKYR